MDFTEICIIGHVKSIVYETSTTQLVESFCFESALKSLQLTCSNDGTTHPERGKQTDH